LCVLGHGSQNVYRLYPIYRLSAFKYKGLLVIGQNLNISSSLIPFFPSWSCGRPTVCVKQASKLQMPGHEESLTE